MKKEFIYLFILIFPIFFASRALFHAGFFRTVDDISVVRINYMEKELRRNNWLNNFPVRLSGELSNNYGYPLYLFYAPLTYYAGAILKILFPLSHIVATKYIYVFPLIFGPFAFYFAARQKMRPFPALVASTFFTLFPYRGFNTYVRGAVAEAWAISFMPLAFGGLFLLQKKKPVGAVIFALSCFLILVSHNIVGFLFLGFTFVYGLLFFLKNKNFWKYLFLALGMSAFFLIPMLYYLKVIRVTYLDVNTTYILGTLIPADKLLNIQKERSLYGEGLLMGISGILFPFIVGGLIYYGYKKYTRHKIFREKFFWGISALILYILLFKPFEFFWQMTMPVTGILQFTWRLLALLAFIIPLFLGLWINDISSLFVKSALTVAVVVSCIIFTANFKPEAYSYFYEYQPEGLCATTSNQDEYLPIWVKGCPPPRTPLEISSKGSIKITEDNSLTVKADVAVEKPGELRINKFYFPGWHVLVDGEESQLDYNFSKDGIFRTSLSPGEHQVEVVYKKTEIMWLSDLFSLTSFSILLYKLWKLRPAHKAIRR
ncbi:MAG: hypothetical protein UV73_C0011G0015 [Candidatus Gottesmanbacteria bacterium GW2011_GWA2_43_14]|uniref:Uncharacterized protein n=1 Tax=Candidatus Gottesmanbacteria bacterium GW2011_GWA2_43_14 TaxID=1618443 RepID=A0A0G1GBN5_9BACT|nr:MAG: hypothetical protein UV73_C0011G0015 [Candidatus Gottesmanbacteria bacterium GW2011_GWA2_43_14]